VRLLQPVQRHRDPLDPGGLGALHHLVAEVARPGDNGDDDPTIAQRPRHLVPILPQIDLTADQGRLAHPGVEELLRHVQQLLGGQLAGTGLPGAAAAVPTAQITRQRQLPDDIERVRLLKVPFFG
jgi:hypothetical protein